MREKCYKEAKDFTTHAEKQILLLKNQRFSVVTETFGADGEFP